MSPKSDSPFIGSRTLTSGVREADNVDPSVLPSFYNITFAAQMAGAIKYMHSFSQALFLYKSTEWQMKIDR